MSATVTVPGRFVIDLTDPNVVTPLVAALNDPTTQARLLAAGLVWGPAKPPPPPVVPPVTPPVVPPVTPPVVPPGPGVVVTADLITTPAGDRIPNLGGRLSGVSPAPTPADPTQLVYPDGTLTLGGP